MKNHKTIEQELEDLEQQLLNLGTRKSISELSGIISDRFIEFGSSGKTYNKKETIEYLQNENIPKMSICDFNIIELGEEHFLVTYKSVKDEDNKKISSLRSSVWKKKGNRYQIIFHQGTTIA